MLPLLSNTLILSGGTLEFGRTNYFPLAVSSVFTVACGFLFVPSVTNPLKSYLCFFGNW